MLLKLGIGAAVALLTAASGFNNWQHLENFGYAIATLVIAGEILKVLLPIAMLEHVKAASAWQWLGTVLVWSILVVFSFVNTFGNVTTKHAQEKARLHAEKVGEVRPEHVILRDMAGLPPCQNKIETRAVNGKAKAVSYQVPNVACQQQRAAQRLALTAELTESKRRELKGMTAAIDGDTVATSQIRLASMFGFEMSKHGAETFMLLLWTLLAEIGSAFGGLCIPRTRQP